MPDSTQPELPEAIEQLCYERWFEAPAHQRRAAIERLCDEHPEHGPAIARQLELLEQSEALLEPLDASCSASRAKFGARIGNFEIRRTLGRGGFGTVYLAQQHEPVKRDVALKVLDTGIGPRGLQRFATERQTLALLRHPAIAQIYDAGTTPEGRMFFAMELVPGEPITEFCDRQRLSIDARLALLQRVCEGVEHAHQRGIVHRDLKPSNVLVAEVDGIARPKIIDFGIAKALDSRDESLTRDGSFLGTPIYSSPEQAAGEVVDTRADVHGLGLLMHELMTGALPYRLDAQAEGSISTALHVVRTAHPRTPSRTLREIGTDAASAAATARNTTAPRLARRMRGDIDRITAHALEREVRARYPSARAVADDLERLRAHEPISARRLTFGYALQKLVRRHRVVLSAATIALVAMTVAAIVAAIRIGRARDNAVIARDRADREAYTAGLTAAWLSMQRGSIREAERLLESTTPALRGWEYDLVATALDRSEGAITIDGAIEACVTPNGEILVGTTRGTLELWDAGQPNAPRTVLALEGSIRMLRGLDNGRHALLAVDASPTSYVALFDIDAAKIVRRFAECSGRWACLDVSADESEFAACCRGDGDTLIFGPIESGGAETRWEKLRRRVMSIAFAPAGRGLFVGDYLGRLIQVDFNREVVEPRFVPSPGDAHRNRVDALTIDPERSLVISGDVGNRIIVWDMVSRAVVAVLETNSGVHELHVDTKRGVLYAIGGWGGRVEAEAWNLDNFLPLGRYVGHRERLTGFTHDDVRDRVVTVSVDGTVRTWPQLPMGEATLRPLGGGDCIGLSYDPESDRLATAAMDGRILVQSMSDGATLLELQLEQRSQVGEWTAIRGNRVYVAAWDHTLRVIDVEAKAVVDSVRVADQGRRLQSVAASPDGLLVTTASCDPPILHCFRALTLERNWSLPLNHQPWHCAFSPDGQRLALLHTLNPSMLIVDSKTGTIESTIDLDAWAMDVSWSPDGKWIGIVDKAHTIFFDATTLRESHRLATPNAYGLAFSPDCRTLVTSGGDRLVHIHDLATGRQLLAIDGQIDFPMFSANGRQLFGLEGYWGQPNRVMVWDAGRTNHTQSR